MPVRIMLDNNVLARAEFAEQTEESRSVTWGKRRVRTAIAGFRRKDPTNDESYQLQINALFTVGRLVREGILEAYTYSELRWEAARAKCRISDFNALKGCKIHHCPPALERSRFRTTSDFRDYLLKGGRKDKLAGILDSGFGQIAFIEWLLKLDERAVDTLVNHADHIGLTGFEVDSLGDLGWLKFVCQRFQSRENYPDAFHLWTAERNGLNVLTLENKLPSQVKAIKGEKRRVREIRADVMRPLDLLCKLGISEPDPVPIEHGRFYTIMDSSRYDQHI
jgi:hypothetical protein